jgi:hypothetical protein
MPDVQAKVKLTAKQQEVVNLMAAGGVLHYSRDMGRFSEASASVRHSGIYHKIAANVPGQLNAKGVVEVDKANNDWRGCNYVLTDLGNGLAKPLENAEPETWWNHMLQKRQFVRSTDGWLFCADGSKMAKSGRYESWFATRQDAVEARRQRLQRDVSAAESALKYAQQALAEFEKKESK